MKRYIKVHNGTEWEEINEEYFYQVRNLKDVEAIYEEFSNKIKVVYKNEDIAYYQNVYGSW